MPKRNEERITVNIETWIALIASILLLSGLMAWVTTLRMFFGALTLSVCFFCSLLLIVGTLHKIGDDIREAIETAKKVSKS